ncbi:MAG: dihydrofolate reductase [Dokdonella sp.]
MTISLVAALGSDSAIGRAGQLPWHLPDDLKRFKSLTLGKPVLMGRKTAESIGRALPGRQNLVLSRSSALPFTGDSVCHVGSVEAALDLVGDAELMVVGGGELYRQTLDLATHLYLTEVAAETPSADAFFPVIDPREWQEIARTLHPSDVRHAVAFSFVDWVRR